MRKWFLISTLSLLLAIWLGIQMEKSPGYVLIAYQNVALEMSLWVALLWLFLIIGILYLGVRLSYHLLSTNGWIPQWNRNRKRRRSQELTLRGMLEFLEGNHERALHHLERGVEHAESPFVNYVLAAKVANDLTMDDKKNEFLQKARTLKTKEKTKIALDILEEKLAMKKPIF